MTAPAFDPGTNKPVFSPAHDKPALDCGGPCPEICDNAQAEYTVTFTGTLTNGTCSECADLVGEFVLVRTGPGCTTGFCCWTYASDACGGMNLTLAISTFVVILTWFTPEIEAQWSWEREGGECSAAALEANLAYETGGETFCSGYSGLTLTVA